MSGSNAEDELVGLDIETLRRLRHDLRSPLLVITGFAQLMRGDREITTEERHQYAERIHAAAEELRALLDETIG